MNQPRYFGRRDAAGYIRISTRKLDELAADEQLPRIKIGGRVLFDLLDQDSFVAEHKEGILTSKELRDE